MKSINGIKATCVAFAIALFSATMGAQAQTSWTISGSGSSYTMTSVPAGWTFTCTVNGNGPARITISGVTAVPGAPATLDLSTIPSTHVLNSFSATAFTSGSAAATARANITSITFPAGGSGNSAFSTIGNSALANCPNLTTVTFLGNPPGSIGNTIYGTGGSLSPNVVTRVPNTPSALTAWNGLNTVTGGTIEAGFAQFMGRPIYYTGFTPAPFVAVSGITTAPPTLSTTVNVPLAFTGTVAPVNATFKSVVWSLVGSPAGVTFNTSTLTFTSTVVGTFTVRATIANGTAVGTPYTQDFPVTVTYIPVSNIAPSFPLYTPPGTPLTLGGTISPSNTSSTSPIVWSVQNAGTTGADITGGNTLNVPSDGTVTVRATIANGAAAGTNYTQDFNVVVSSVSPGALWYYDAAAGQLTNATWKLNVNAVVVGGVTQLTLGKGSMCVVQGPGSGQTAPLDFSTGISPAGCVITAINNSAFSDYGRIERLVLPDTLTTIGNHSFYNVGLLTGDLVIPPSVTSIGTQAFYVLRTTGNVVMGGGASLTVGNDAFYQGTYGGLIMLEGVTSIGTTAFTASKFSSDLVFPESLTSIGGNAFYNAMLPVGGNVTMGGGTSLTIGSDAFRNLKDLTGTSHTLGTLTFREGGATTVGDGAFWAAGFSGDLFIPNGVISLGNHAFDSCSGFTGNLVIGNTCKTISGYAFWACNFTGYVVIAEGVQTVGSWAFNSKFERVYVMGPPSMFSGSNIFDANAKNVDLVTVLPGMGWETAVNNPTTANNLGKTYLTKVDALTQNDARFTSHFANYTPVGYGGVPLAYTVRFDADGGDGIMPDQKYMFYTTYSLPHNGFNKGGQDFLGWSLTAGGEVVYLDQQPVRDLVTIGTSAITLYAVWGTASRTGYIVFFDGNGADAHGPTMGTWHRAFDVSANIPSNQFKKSGYDFNGWILAIPDKSVSGVTNFVDAQSVGDFTVMTGETVGITLVAKWLVNLPPEWKYTVHFDKGAPDATGTMTDWSPRTIGLPERIPANAFTRAGYAFLGWTSDFDTGTLYTDWQLVGDLVSAGTSDVTLTAQWGILPTLTITFDYNKSTVTNETSKVVTPNATYGTLPLTARTDWLFMGWYRDTKPVISATQVETAGDHKLGAVWFRPNDDLLTDSDVIGDIDFPAGTTGATNGAPVEITIDDGKGGQTIVRGHLRGPKGNGEFEVVLDEPLPPGGGTITDITVNPGGKDAIDIETEIPITVGLHLADVFLTPVVYVGETNIGYCVWNPDSPGCTNGAPICVYFADEDGTPPHYGHLEINASGTLDIILDDPLDEGLIGPHVTTVSLVLNPLATGEQTFSSLSDEIIRAGILDVIDGEELTAGDEDIPVGTYTPPSSYQGDKTNLVVEIIIGEGGNKETYEGYIDEAGNVLLKGPLSGKHLGKKVPFTVIIKDENGTEEFDRDTGEVTIIGGDTTVEPAIPTGGGEGEDGHTKVGHYDPPSDWEGDSTELVVIVTIDGEDYPAYMDEHGDIYIKKPIPEDLAGEDVGITITVKNPEGTITLNATEDGAKVNIAGDDWQWLTIGEIIAPPAIANDVLLSWDTAQITWNTRAQEGKVTTKYIVYTSDTLMKVVDEWETFDTAELADAGFITKELSYTRTDWLRFRMLGSGNDTTRFYKVKAVKVQK